MTSVFHQVGNVAVWVAFIAAVLFCAGYAVLAPWRSSAEGQHLMMFTAVIGSAFGWIAFRQVISSAPPAALSVEVPRAVILSALAAGLVWRLALLIRNQVQRRRR